MLFTVLFWVFFLSMVSRVEDFVEAYFILKNYLVLRNVPFRPRKRWKDVDVLALNDKKLYIVECKRGAVASPSKIIEHLFSAEKFLRTTSPYREIIEKLGLVIKKMYVAEYIRKEKEAIKNAGIEVKNVSEIVREIVKIVGENVSKKKIEGAYPNPLIRYTVLLYKTKHLR